MSWNKNTRNESEVNSVVRTLKKLGVKYKLTTIGSVQGMGLNDDYRKSSLYKLRKLEYKDVVLLEKMVRSTDCDSDDVIISKEFKANKLPSEWVLEIVFDNDTGKIIKAIKWQ